MGCSFCNILKNNKEKVLKENKYTFVVLSDPKLMDGHLLLIPKRHVEKMGDLNHDEREELFTEIIRMQEKILEKISAGCDICQHYRPFIPDNKFKISHLHMHIRPRFLDDELYEKVQKFENQVFKDVRDEEIKKYKDLLI